VCSIKNDDLTTLTTKTCDIDIKTDRIDNIELKTNSILTNVGTLQGDVVYLKDRMVNLNDDVYAL